MVEGGGAGGDEGVGAVLLEQAPAFLIDTAFLGGIEKDCSLLENGLRAFLLAPIFCYIFLARGWIRSLSGRSRC